MEVMGLSDPGCNPIVTYIVIDSISDILSNNRRTSRELMKYAFEKANLLI